MANNLTVYDEPMQVPIDGDFGPKSETAQTRQQGTTSNSAILSDSGKQTPVPDERGFFFFQFFRLPTAHTPLGT